jgi:hypothetical protein
MTAKTGVFEGCSGFLSENPRPRNPCRAWAAGSYRGIRGWSMRHRTMLCIVFVIRSCHSLFRSGVELLRKVSSGERELVEAV